MKKEYQRSGIRDQEGWRGVRAAWGGVSWDVRSLASLPQLTALSANGMTMRHLRSWVGNLGIEATVGKSHGPEGPELQESKS